MNYRNFLLGTLAYALPTFPLAAIWHAVLFKPFYMEFGYFEGEPNFLAGFTAILLQGLVLSFLYERISIVGTGIARGLKYASVLGLFFWTSHVLATVAKQEMPNPLHFVFLETFYVALQFCLFGVLIGLVGRARSTSKQAE